MAHIVEQPLSLFTKSTVPVPDFLPYGWSSYNSPLTQSQSVIFVPPAPGTARYGTWPPVFPRYKLQHSPTQHKRLSQLLLSNLYDKKRAIRRKKQSAMTVKFRNIRHTNQCTSNIKGCALFYLMCKAEFKKELVK